MPMLQVLQTIWNRPLSAVACLLVILWVTLTINHVAPYVRTAQNVDRVELLLWQQLDPGKISSRLTEIELAELTAEMDAEQAARFRQDLERNRENLRQEVRRMAHEIVNQERKQEPERPREKISAEPDVPYAEVMGEMVSEQAAGIRSLREQRRQLEREQRRKQRGK